LYYFAIVRSHLSRVIDTMKRTAGFEQVTNFVIRFSWIMYLPSGGMPYEVRTFVVAMLEMLRRWQWNFLRLENEHLGNIDQYRATRDVPLPYGVDSSANDPDEDWELSSPKGLIGRIVTSWNGSYDKQMDF